MTAPEHRKNLLLAQAATVVALSIALGNIRLLELPAGGSISCGSLPVLAFAAVAGVRAGMLAAVAAGVGHALAGGTIVHPIQLLLDYGLGYASLALAGLGLHRGRAAQRAAVFTACCAQFVCFVVSGVVFFGTTVDEHAALAYSVTYNTTTMLPETLLAMWLVPSLATVLARTMSPQPNRLADHPRRVQPHVCGARPQPIASQSCAHPEPSGQAPVPAGRPAPTPVRRIMSAPPPPSIGTPTPTRITGRPSLFATAIAADRGSVRRPVS